MVDKLPPAWHAHRLQGFDSNCFSTLVDLGDALPGMPEEPKLQQWIPERVCISKAILFHI